MQHMETFMSVVLGLLSAKLWENLPSYINRDQLKYPLKHV